MIDSNQELTTADEMLSTPSSIAPIGLRVDGQAVQSTYGPEGIPLLRASTKSSPTTSAITIVYSVDTKVTNLGKTTYLTDSPEAATVALAESAYMRKKVNVQLSLNKESPLVPTGIWRSCAVEDRPEEYLLSSAGAD